MTPSPAGPPGDAGPQDCPLAAAGWEERAMRIVTFRGDSVVEVADRPVPEAGPGQVLIKIGASAICGSALGETKETASMRRIPVTLSASMNPILSPVSMCSCSLWMPSRGPTSRNVMAFGQLTGSSIPAGVWR